MKIGTVNQTRFTSLDRLNIGSIWLLNQTSPHKCICAALGQFNNVVALNSYSNGSCQLFLSLPYMYTMEYNLNSTLILLSPLPPTTTAPCCSNLTWLMTRLKNSSLKSYNISNPTYLVIDDHDYLTVIQYNGVLQRLNRTTMTHVANIPVAGQCTSVSYYNSQYFVGCVIGTASMIYVYSTATLTHTANISMPGEAREVVFIRNGTVMLAAIRGTSVIAFYNVTSPTSYTLTSTLPAPQIPFTLHRINDAYMIIGGIDTYSSLHTLSYSNTSRNWTWGILPATIINGTNYNFQATVDPCGRLWATVRGYGIRIYDSTASTLLYEWPLSIGTNGITMHNNFDLYVGDFPGNLIYGYRPNIAQCTF